MDTAKLQKGKIIGSPMCLGFVRADGRKQKRRKSGCYVATSVNRHSFGHDCLANIDI